MSVYLEKFSRVKPLQGVQVHELVASNSDWLKNDRPEAWERYRDTPHAVKNIARIAVVEGFQAYIIRGSKHDTARGLATLIFNQAVVHPDPKIGEVAGDDLDYWLSPDETPDFHAKVAEALLQASRERIKSHPENGPYVESDRAAKLGHFGSMAVIQTDLINPPIGLMGPNHLGSPRFHELGDPAELSTPIGADDPYDIAHKEHVSQIYYAYGGLR
jgi:hypothetical protein